LNLKIKFISIFSPAKIIAVLQKTLSTNHHLILKQKYDVVVEGEDTQNNVPIGEVMNNAYQIIGENSDRKIQSFHLVKASAALIQNGILKEFSCHLKFSTAPISLDFSACYSL
jgi:hypothetical protein